MTPEAANAIYDVLMEYAGANGYWRGPFLSDMANDITVFRFAGSMGFGGRFYIKPDRWVVDCYDIEREDRRNKATITRTNEALAQVRAKFGGAAM